MCEKDQFFGWSMVKNHRVKHYLKAFHLKMGQLLTVQLLISLWCTGQNLLLLYGWSWVQIKEAFTHCKSCGLSTLWNRPDNAVIFNLSLSSSALSGFQLQLLVVSRLSQHVCGCCKKIANSRTLGKIPEIWDTDSPSFQ